MLKKVILVTIAVIICSAIFLGWKLTSRNAYESAEYVVIESDGPIELREYPDLMLAATEMGTNTDGDDGSFGRLFRYISGNNEDKQKVAMTTPVFMEPKSQNDSSAPSQNDRGQMGFVIPKDVVETSIPQPLGDNVQVTKRLGGTFAVIRFAGQMNAETQQRQRELLTDWIEKKGLQPDQPAGEAEIASYDPPWTPGPLRRNEILIRIAAVK
jgi:hypothetical protein